MNDISLFYDDPLITELTPDDFSSLFTWLLNDKKYVVVLFYKSSCPHCIEMIDTWKSLSRVTMQCTSLLRCNVAAMNCELYDEYIVSLKEEAPQLLKSFPTMVLYRYGIPIVKIGTDTRNIDELISQLSFACSLNDRSMIDQ